MNENLSDLHRQQKLYWDQMFELKRAVSYIRLYRDSLGKRVTWLGALKAIASCGGIAAWVIWKEYAFVWGAIIAASQLALRAAELEEAFHLETERVIGNDWVVRHDNRYFQVKAQARQYAPAKGKVTVWEWEDGRLQIRYRGRAVAWEEIPSPVPVQAVRASETKKPKPRTAQAADHPWRQGYRKMRPWGKPAIPEPPAIAMVAASASPYRG